MNLTYSEHPIWASGSALQKKEVSSSISLPKDKNHPKRGAGLFSSTSLHRHIPAGVASWGKGGTTQNWVI